MSPWQARRPHVTGRNVKPLPAGAASIIEARHRAPIKKDPQRVARRRRIEQLLEEQQARKEDPLWTSNN